MFNKLRVDIENLLQRSHHKVELVSADLNETIGKVHEKLKRVDDTSKVQDWVEFKIKESESKSILLNISYIIAMNNRQIQKDFEYMEEKINRKLFVIKRDHFIIPGLVGVSESHQNLSTFLKDQHEQVNQKFETLLEEIEDRINRNKVRIFISLYVVQSNQGLVIDNLQKSVEKKLETIQEDQEKYDMIIKNSKF